MSPPDSPLSPSSLPVLEVGRFCDHVLQIDEENCIDFIWADARDISQVYVTFEPNFVYIGTAPLISGVFYWKYNWPEKRPQEKEKEGSGQSGWAAQDDWYKGTWRSADITSKRHPGVPLTMSFTFNPLASKEYPVTFRRSLKLRIQFNKKVVNINKIKDVKIYTSTACQPMAFSIAGDYEWINRDNAFTASIWNGYFSINGKPVEDMKVGCAYEKPVSLFASTVVEPWSFDGTQVSIWIPGKKSLTFSMVDLAKRGFIMIPDLHVVISADGKNMSWGEAISEIGAGHAEDDGKRRGSIENPALEGKCVYDRVFELPEQNFTRAMASFKGKQLMSFILGCEGVRAKCALSISGNAHVSNKFIKKVDGPDSSRVYWNNLLSKTCALFTVDDISPGLDLKGMMKERMLLDDYLPVLLTTWELPRNIGISQEAYATLLAGTTPGKLPNGDDDAVLMEKLVISNNSDAAHEVSVVISFGETGGINDSALPEPLFEHISVTKVDGVNGHVVSLKKKSDQEYTCIVEPQDAGTAVVGEDDALPSIEISTKIPPKESREIRFKMPLLAISAESAKNSLAKLSYDVERERVATYWKERISHAADIDVPNDEFTAFYKAHVYHVLVSNDRQIGSDLVFGRVGSLVYGTFANEVCMICMDLDRRGLHDEARKILDVFVKYQGTQGLLGDYDNIDGIFFGANGYENGNGYNQNQGFVLWAMAEHARLSGDIEWFKRNADAIIKACDWIARERKIFQETLETRKVAGFRVHTEVYKGLLPAGGVEDVQDYWYWLSTNAYNSFGLSHAANMLAVAGHPDAERIGTEASDYANAVKKAFETGLVSCPVVPLRDGTYVPHFPCRLPRRGRGFGWIQETLEGPIHLLRCWIVSPFSNEAAWIVKDYEDNLYLSEEFGYQILGEHFEKKWFDLGGFSQQPFLFCNPWPYGIRGNTKHYLRAVLNAFAVNYRDDTKSFCEHPLPTMMDVRGDFFKTSDEANFCSSLRDMIVQETIASVDNVIAGWEENFSKHPNKESMESLHLFGRWDRMDALRILYHAPREWFLDGNEIHAKQLPTYFGKCSVDMTSKGGRVDITISIEQGESWQNGMLLKALFIKARCPEPAKIERAIIEIVETSDAGVNANQIEPSFIQPRAVGIDLSPVLSPSWDNITIHARLFFRPPTPDETKPGIYAS
nr:hypothetical protein [Candidatus Sigynarchaeota archaeon]